MSLELATFISTLSPSNPPGTDLRKQGDDHLRLIKAVLQATFPNASKAFYFPDASAKTANYTVLASEQNKFVACDTVGGAFDITLPVLAIGDAGWMCVVYKTNVGLSKLGIVPSAGLINGLARQDFYLQNSYAICVWNGTAWYTLSNSVLPLLYSRKTAGYAVIASDLGRTIESSGSALTFTIGATAAVLGDGFYFYAWNRSTTSTHTLIIDPSGAELIDGSATLTLYPNEMVLIYTDGATWYTQALIGYDSRPTVSINVAGITNDLDTVIVGGHAAIRLNATAYTVLTGMVSNGSADQSRIIVNTGSFDILIVDDVVTSSSANNRFQHGTNSRSFVLRPSEVMEFYYDNSTNRWRVRAKPSRVGINQLSADVINNNGVANTIADVTGLSFDVVAGQRYKFKFTIIYSAAATTTGSRWSINGPAFTSLEYTADWSLTLTSQSHNEAAAYDAPAASNATSGATTRNKAVIEGVILPSADGTVIARFASEVAGSAITAIALDSFVEWEALDHT